MTKLELSMNKTWCQELGYLKSTDVESLRSDNMQYITSGQSHQYTKFGSIVNVLDKIYFCVIASLPQLLEKCGIFECY